MPVITLTDLAIQRLRASESYTTYYDAALPSFGIRVGKRARTFVILNGPMRRRISLGRYPVVTLKEARLKAHAILGGTIVPEQKDAPKALYVLDQFLEAHQRTTRSSTHREARRLLARHFAAPFGRRHLDDITTQDLTRSIDGLLRTPAEAIKAHAAISAFFNWAVRREYIERNPLAGIPLPAKPKTRDRVLSDHELGAVLKTALQLIHTPFGMIIIVLAHTGLRKTEAHTLSWPCITRDTITIPAHLSKNNTELVLPNTINGYLASVPKTGPALFPLELRWQKAKAEFDKRSGVTGWVLHDLRRTLSTKMAEWEIAPPDVVEAILNHKSGSRSQIQRVYDRHSRLPQMRRALSAYADRLHAMMKAH
jgi:integrase